MFDTEDFEEIVIGRAPNAETIILRRDKKLVRRNKRLGINADTEPQIEYPDTPDTIRMRENLKRINAKLRDCGASLLPGENAFWKCAERMAQKGERGPLLCTQNHLHRVFNNGSFTDGGRLVGGWWQGVPREYRKFIYISDIPSIELDYASLHPTMLYHQRGLDVDGDPYAIDGLPRDVAKKLFNALVNGRSHFSQDTRRMVTDTGMSWDDAVSAVRERHPQISDSLGSGAGVRLQRIDSDIAEDVLLTMLDQGITCLPIHDSFIVQFCHEKALRDAMQAAYGRQFQGWKIGIERKPSILDGGG
ncbi:hypothetical protein BAL199_14262 [alpha proteobacterium BAL199]|nr:hypothetical protein BAL199_14262 [alpha proteobacterium BAL199]